MAQTARRKRQPLKNPEPVPVVSPPTEFEAAIPYIIGALIVIATLVVYWQTVGFGFITMDDYLYVTHNTHVQSGLNGQSIAWAFTGYGAGNWHPLTWLSLMVNHDTTEMNPSSYHFTNILLHIANALLLLVVLTRLTGRFWRSAFVAALFALHPLHVESVAWISERKDVLSTFFWFLALWAYARYASSQSLARYLLVACAFVLGLMSKPMLVTLPLTLLLLDFWPLQRFRISDLGSRTSADRANPLWDKVPLLAITGVSCVVTVLAQRAGNAVAPLKALPLNARIPNVIVSYVSYLGNTFWPSRLAPFYPHPVYSVPEWQIAASLLLLVGITYFAIRGARSRPYFLFGWLWYIVTLIPVIGIMQVGSQAMADRYAYVPLIGIFVIIAWGIPDLLGGRSGSASLTAVSEQGIVLASLAVAALLALTVSAYSQTRHWKSDLTIWKHTVKVTKSNSLAQYNLACAYDERKMYPQAIEHYLEALRQEPRKSEALNNLGNIYMKLGNLDEAERCLRRALEVKPNYSEANCNLGLVLSKKKNFKESLHHYAQSLAAAPHDAVVRFNYAGAECDQGIALAGEGRPDDAIMHFRRAIQIDPKDAVAYYNLGVALDGEGKLDEAIAQYRLAVHFDPKHADAHNNLGVCLGQQGKYDEAVEQFSEALRIRPDLEKARVSLDHFSMLRAQQRR